MNIEKCQLCLTGLNNNQIVKDCLPVSSFGDVEGKAVKAATVGINPALNEFIVNGEPKQRSQRLPILSDYQITNRTDLKIADLAEAKNRRATYFKDVERYWHSYFEKMESLISRVDPRWSYISGRVVHVDLVACATRVRWSALENHTKTTLLTNCRPHFLTALSQLPQGTLLFLDGLAVINEFRKFGAVFEQKNEQLINIRGNRGVIGNLKLSDNIFPIRGWSIPISKLSQIWRYDLAFWLCGTIQPRQPFLPIS
jgi:hypothetical protein